MSVTIWAPSEVVEHIAGAARAKRLSLNFTQRSVAMRSGVSLAVLKKFERTGKISLESLVKIALVLDSLEDFLHVFKPIPPEQMLTLDEILKDTTTRERGRQ